MQIHFLNLKNIQMQMFFKLEQLYGLNWRQQLQTLPIYYLNATSRILLRILGHRLDAGVGCK
jgi:hypothetical protein